MVSGSAVALDEDPELDGVVGIADGDVYNFGPFSAPLVSVPLVVKYSGSDVILTKSYSGTTEDVIDITDLI